MRVFPAKFDEFGIYKYVRFADDEVRFCLNSDPHDTLKGGADKFPPVSAGVIGVAMKGWSFVDKGSMTLKLGGLGDDDKAIEKVMRPLGYRQRKKS